MPSRKPSALYFTTVSVLQDGLAVLGGHLYIQETEPNMTRFIVRHPAGWGHLYDVDEIVYATERLPKPPGKPRDTFCLMGRWGAFRETPSGEASRDVQLDTKGGYMLHDLRRVGDHLFSCGTMRMVWRRDGDAWVRADAGAFEPLTLERMAIFFSIDGFSRDDVYAVGMGGALWHWDGKAWTELDSPTNIDLKAVLCMPGGDVYVAGGGGLLFKGDARRGWTDLSAPDVATDTIWRMTRYRDQVYMAAYRHLLVSDGGPLRAVDVPLEGEKTFMALDANENQLWTVGDDNIFHFDGAAWTRHVCTEND